MCDDFFDEFDGFDWDDWILIGPISEEIAREKDSSRRENDEDDGDYWDIIELKW